MTWDDIYLRQGIVQHAPMSVVVDLVDELRKLGPQQSWRILDAGCGTGRHAFFSASGLPEAQVYCCDSSPHAITIFREKLPTDLESRMTLEIIDLDVDGQRIPTNFDAVISTLTIHHGDWHQFEFRFDLLVQSLSQEGLFAFACLSDEDPRAQTGEEVGPRTRINTAQDDGDVLHHFSNVEDLKKLFGSYENLEIIKQELVSQPGTTFSGTAKYWEILAKKRLG